MLYRECADDVELRDTPGYASYDVHFVYPGVPVFDIFRAGAGGLHSTEN